MQRIFSVILGLVSVMSAGALTVDQAVVQATTHNLGLQTEDLKLAQKADEKNFSFNRLYPSITTNATLLHLNNLNFSNYEGLWNGLEGQIAGVTGTNVPFSAVTDQLTDDYHWNLAVGLNVQFTWSLAAFRGIVQTVIDYNNEALNRKAAAAKLGRDVRKAFYQLLALHSAVDVFQSEVKVAQDRYTLSKANAEAGLGSELSMLQAQVSYENRKPPLADQRLNEQNAQAAFRILLDLPDGAPLDLEGSLDVTPDELKTALSLDPEKLILAHLSSRYDVNQAQGAVKSLANIADLQSETEWPALLFGFSADPTVNAPFKDDAWKSPSNWMQTSGNFMVGLGWKLDNFLPGSTTGIQIEGWRRQAKEAQLGAEQTLRGGAQDIRSLVGRLKKSATSLDGLRLSVKLAQKSADLSADGYSAGTTSFNDTQDADQQLQQAKLQLLNEELTFRSTLADLDFALAADRQGWFHE